MNIATFQYGEKEEQLRSAFQGDLGDSVIASEEPVIVRFKDCRTAEFGSVQGAKDWLERAAVVDAAEAAEARVYAFEGGHWGLR